MDDKLHYVEEVGLYFEKIGLQRMAGRVIGWLLVCDPPHQTMPAITEALQASKSSISTALRTLVQLYLVEQFSIPGERRDYYKLSNDAWHRSFRSRLHQVTELSQLAERGLAVLEGESEELRERLELMRAMNDFLGREFPRLLDEWEAQWRARKEQKP